MQQGEGARSHRASGSHRRPPLLSSTSTPPRNTMDNRHIDTFRQEVLEHPERYRQIEPDPLPRKEKIEHGMGPIPKDREGYNAWQRGYQKLVRRTRRGRWRMTASNLRARHKMSLVAYSRLYEKQRGVCAICGRAITMGYDPDRSTGKRGPPPGAGHIDHDHGCCAGNRSCGRCIRGLLCAACNVGLGRFRDDPQLLQAALRYLDRGPQVPRI